MAYPDSTIYLLSRQGIEEVRYEDTEHFCLTRDFLLHVERFLEAIFGTQRDGEAP